MNKLQQVAEKYAEEMFYQPADIENGVETFLAGAAYAAGAFAEWCGNNNWSYQKMMGWSHPKSLKFKTTAELYELWQQSI